MKKHIVLFLCSGIIFCSCTPKNIHPTGLTCEYQTNPEAVDAQKPRLGWYNEIQTTGDRQTAWQIQVASSRKLLQSGKADVWDSGKIDGESQPYQNYAGQALLSAQKYWWRVRVWDSQDKPSSWSETACWGSGYLNEGEWTAQWIGAPWDEEGPRDLKGNEIVTNKAGDLPTLQRLSPSTPAPLIRKKFFIDKEVASARLYATGLGYHELYLNGRKIGEDLLSPNQTDYSVREQMMERRLPLDLKSQAQSVMYLGHDLTSLVHKGENILGCILGNGFFNTVHIWTAGYASPRFIAQLEITYTDGTRETILSDDTWQVRESAIRKNDVFGGETYDARYETADWCMPKSSDEGWTSAVLRQAPTGKLTAQTGPADRLLETLHPTRIEKTSEGTFRVEFPEEISGRVRLCHIANAEGDTIRIHYKDASNGAYEYNGENVYICGGKGNESYAARFTWFVFHTATVEGWKGELTAKDISAEVVGSDVPVCGNFTCSNESLNQILRMWQRTQKNNMHGSVPTDCPHRERGPYTGDGQLACTMVMQNFQAASFYRKWIADISNSQDSISGYVPNGSPWEPGCGGGVAWGLAMTVVPWEFYKAYGDRQLLEQYYNAMKAQNDYMATWETPEGTMRARVCNDNFIMNLGEHVPPFSTPEQEAVHTYCWWQSNDCMAQAARVLGKEQDAERYSTQANRIHEAYLHRYYNDETGSCGQDEYNIFAMRMGLPDSIQPRILEAVQQDIKERDGHLLTGYIGSRIFFESLASYGLSELAYSTMMRPGVPGYLEMLEQGSTTFWEQWDGKHSHDHPALGSGLVWLSQYIAGIQPCPDAPGYKRFLLQPTLISDLSYAEYSLRTVFGPLSSRWEKTSEGLSMDITVPEGCTAQLRWPVENVEVKGIPSSAQEDVYLLPGGQYHLTSTLP